MNKVRRLFYIVPQEKKSEIDMFKVDKGSTYIRLVYNGTSCDLNEVLWDPWFALPAIGLHLRSVEVGTKLDNVDVGICFIIS